MLACIPDPFRPDIRPEKKPSRISWFYALDLPSGNRVANLMVVPLSGSDAPHSLNEAKVDAKRNLSEVIDLKEPFRWSEEDGDEHFAITPSLKNGKGWVQILIARTNEKSVAVFVLQCDSVANLEATDGMDGALVLLRRSIQSALKNSPSKQP